MRKESKLSIKGCNQATKKENKRRKGQRGTTKTENDKMAVGAYPSIIILNVNGLNFPKQKA